MVSKGLEDSLIALQTLQYLNQKTKGTIIKTEMI